MITHKGDTIQQLTEMVIHEEWSIDEWRGQLANAKQLQHELDQEALTEGRCNCGWLHFPWEACQHEDNVTCD